jgi:hypothetical protein
LRIIFDSLCCYRFVFLFSFYEGIHDGVSFRVVTFL